MPVTDCCTPKGYRHIIVNVPNAFEGGVISRFAEEVFPRVGV